MNNNPLTNQSYINKDFQTIYPELLDLVKKLSYKWDPTISNESDPGVILIKLNALIADKNNYNIDKNILECFPDSVTQHSNAYKLFEQLGYNMGWYKAAKGDVVFRWKSEKLTVSFGEATGVKVPQFTMVSDDDKNLVYTTLDECTVKFNGENTSVGAIQGVIRDLTIGGSNLIRHTMLDHKNRLYFPVSNVAENGIFISDANRNTSTNETEFIWRNPDTSTVEGWKSVDNLYIYPINYKCYKVGIDQTNNSFYIEFPPNAANLMGEGLQIKYIQTDGAAGNIAAKRLSQFYSDVTVEIEGSPVNISKDITVANYTSITNGAEPETIDDAYVNYKKMIGTFDTLVTLKDYLNYITNDKFEIVSNGVVSDRLNDIQSSYKIVTTNDDNTRTLHCVADEITTKTYADDTTIVTSSPQMDAFDLKTYFLEYSQWPKFTASVDDTSQMTYFKDAYDKSFELKLCEDYNTDVLDTGNLKNLYNGAKRIEHDFIPKLHNKPLFFKNKFKLKMSIIPDNMVSESQATNIERNVQEALLKNLASNNISFGEEISFERIYDICNNADPRIKAIALDPIEYTPYAVIYFDDDFLTYNETSDKYSIEDGAGNALTVLDANGKEMDVRPGLNEIPVSLSVEKGTLTYNDLLALEICAKNVLAGTTPLYHPQNKFSYHIGQKGLYTIEDVLKVTTFSEIVFNDVGESYNDNDGNTEASTLLENESVFLYAPSMSDIKEYSQSIKYIYIVDDDYIGEDTDYIPANVDYVLEKGQHLFMFWKTEDSKDAPYQYSKYGEGTILRAGTRLIKSSHQNYGSICALLLANGYSGEGQILGDLNDKLYDISDTILSSTKGVVIKGLNYVNLTDENNYCYWVTNDRRNDSGVQYYDLTLNYVEPITTNISESYHSGLVYVSNFDWKGENKQLDSVRTLGENGNNEKIYILEVIPKRVSHTARNDVTKALFVEEIKVNDYKIKEILKKDDKIRCTGDIIKADDEILELISKGTYNVGSTISWGDFVTQFDEETLVPVADNHVVSNIDVIDKYFAGCEYKLVCTHANDAEDEWVITKTDGSKFYNEENGIDLSSLTLYTSKLSYYEVSFEYGDLKDETYFHDILEGDPNSKGNKDHFQGILENIYLPTIDGDTVKVTNVRKLDSYCISYEWKPSTSDGGFVSEPSRYYPILTLTNYNYEPIRFKFQKGDYFTFKMGPSSPISSIDCYRTTPVQARGYSKPQENPLAKGLDAMTYSILSNGYRLEVIGDNPGISKTEGTSKYEYILKNNEEFIYTDRDKKGLYLHGNGTKVEIEIMNKDIIDGWTGTEDNPIPPSTLKYSVKAMDSSTIKENQLAAFTDTMWYNFKCRCEVDDNNEVISHTGGSIVSLTENQIILLGEGTQIRVKVNPIHVPTYDSEKSQIGTTTEYDKNLSNLKINSSGVYVKSNESSDWNKVRNVLSNYTIQYKGKDEESWTTLPSSSHPNIGWDGYMILNIVSGPNNPQKLYDTHKHSFTIYQVKDNEDHYVYSESGVIYVQTSADIRLTGGTDVDLTGKTINGDTVYMDMMIYEESTINDTITGTKDAYDVDKDGEDLVITINGGNSGSEDAQTVSIKYSIPVGISMIQPIEFLKDVGSVDYFSISTEKGQTTVDAPIKGFEEVGQDADIVSPLVSNNQIKRGIYYVDITGYENWEFNYKGEDKISFVLKGMFPYTYTDESIENDKKVNQDRLESKISEIDKDHKFDYTYKPSRNSKIVNPLSARSYFNTTHICNEFVIPQISEISMNTVNKRS